MLIKLLKKANSLLGFPREFGWLLRFELGLLIVRISNRLSPAYWIKVKRLRASKDLKIIFGPGETIAQGWTGVDAANGKGVDLRCDLRKPLPFASGSASLIYHEHFLEHLEYDEARLFLTECLRILKPGGRMRVVAPDMESFLKAYMDGDEAFFELASSHEPHPVKSLNLLFRWYGSHKFAYDFKTLAALLEEVGFAQISRSSCNASSVAELNIDTDTPQRQAESLYLEAIKPIEG